MKPTTRCYGKKKKKNFFWIFKTSPFIFNKATRQTMEREKKTEMKRL
jgi:hypothetical protein